MGAGDGSDGDGGGGGLWSVVTVVAVDALVEVMVAEANGAEAVW